MSAYRPVLRVCRKNVLELCQMINFLQRSPKISSSRLFSTCKTLCDKKDKGPDGDDKPSDQIKTKRERQIKVNIRTEKDISKIQAVRAALKKKQEIDPKLKEATKSIGNAVPSIGKDLLDHLQTQKSKDNKDLGKGVIELKKKPTPELSNSFRNLLQNMKKGESLENLEAMRKSKKLRQAISKDDAVYGQTGIRKQQMPEYRSKNEKNVVLFEGQGLGIFDEDFAVKHSKSDTKEEKTYQWESLWDIEQRESIEKKEMFPFNAFEEMIKWTKEGKMWHFPISNYQGWTEEENVEFHEHVFLDDFIQDFPKTGPIRHFMELVITGLSQNPHISAQEKWEHIDWFRQYFTNKQDLLKEALGEEGVMGIQEDSNQDVGIQEEALSGQ